jgi:hypothetical protein
MPAGVFAATGETFSLVVVNFTDQLQTTSFAFPYGQLCRQIEGTQNLNSVVAGAARRSQCPATTGIWTVGG